MARAAESGRRRRISVVPQEGTSGAGVAAVVILGIDPGLTRCGYAALEPATGPRRSAPWRSACSAPPPSDPLPQRLAELRRELAALIAELRPDVVAVEQVFFQVNVRTAMSVGQASGLALAEAAAGRLRGRAVHPEPGEGGRRRLGRRPARSRCSGWCRRGSGWPRRPQPADAADAAALALCHLAMAPLQAPARPRRPEDADDRLAAGHGARARRRRRGAGRGGRRRLPRHRHAPHAGRARARRRRLPLRPPPHPRGRPDAVRLPRAATSGPRFEVAARRPRRRAGPGPGHPRRPHARAALADVVADGDLGALCLVPGVGQEDGRAAAGRAAAAGSTVPCSTTVVAGRQRRGRAAVGDVREALAGLGYGPDEIRDALRELAARRRRGRRCCATRCKVLGARRA